MRVIIAGSRGMRSEGTLTDGMSRVDWPISCVISGDANGPDKLGADWARRMSIAVEVYPANWSEEGLKAGTSRNTQMGNIADALVAFWDGHSSGTKHMINTMHRLGKPVIVIDVPRSVKETAGAKLFYHAESDSALLSNDDWVEGCDMVAAHKLPLGTVIENVGIGTSTVIADLDFETYSEAGYRFDDVKKKWIKSLGAPKGAQSGLGVVGVYNYVSHPTAEILSLAYDLKDGIGSRLWFPGLPFPQDLLDYVARGGLVGAWNANFEYWAWEFLCHKAMGWPKLEFFNLRCDMAKAMAHGLPGKLEDAGPAVGSAVRKGADGKRLLNKFSIPQHPLKKCPDRRRTFIKDEPIDGPKLYEYNIGDIQTEAAVSALVPDLSSYELAIWKYDQAINVRGVQIDISAVKDFIAIVYQSQDKYRRELVAITGGAVDTEGKLKEMKKWAETHGVYWSTIDKDAIDSVIDTCPPHEGAKLSPVRRVLEIRKILGSAAIKKLFAMDLKATPAGRMHGVFSYCGAQKTGRWAGRDVQPQNMPAKGLDVAICNCCGGIVWAKAKTCFHCGDLIQGFTDLRPDGTKVEWDEDGVSAVIKCAQNRDLAHFEQYWGNAYDAISACLRGLLSAAPGFDLICSDFSAIEAVVLAFASGCQWRMDVFNTHGKIYEQSAANVAGVEFSEMMSHAGYNDLNAPEWWSAPQTGPHHPLRKTLGKVCELASGYQGWIGAWLQFGAGKFMTEDEIKKAILKWRDASPEIVEFWGGQYRRVGYRQTKVEYFGVEGCAVAAVLNPGMVFRHTCLEFGVKDDILYIKLPSGRSLTYHKPRLLDSLDPLGNDIKQLTFMGVHPTTKKWVLRDTYGGRLTENIIQGIARDIQANSIALLENAGYSVVLHVHDEIISEVREGSGNIEEFERIMSTMPDWCANWPVKAKGGWRGKRYKKD